MPLKSSDQTSNALSGCTKYTFRRHMMEFYDEWLASCVHQNMAIEKMNTI